MLSGRLVAGAAAARRRRGPGPQNRGRPVFLCGRCRGALPGRRLWRLVCLLVCLFACLLVLTRGFWLACWLVGLFTCGLVGSLPVF